MQSPPLNLEIDPQYKLHHFEGIAKTTDEELEKRRVAPWVNWTHYPNGMKIGDHYYYTPMRLGKNVFASLCTVVNPGDVFKSMTWHHADSVTWLTSDEHCQGHAVVADIWYPFSPYLKHRFCRGRDQRADLRPIVCKCASPTITPVQLGIAGAAELIHICNVCKTELTWREE